jgi:hypothetical protein
MKRGLLILGLGVAGMAAAYVGTYHLGTARHRAMMRTERPELAWLRHEFNLGDDEFKRVSELHDDYLPQRIENYRRIDALNDRLADFIAGSTHVTPELEKLLGERAQIRAACQAEMLRHFFEISRTMPPEQGKRYLAWARENTCIREQPPASGMNTRFIPTSPERNP